ncbi:MAG: hypothetical protein E7256_13495 [Lachnospiraceae bacterium]|nr:hypothetical protein [Lachnospiraceae bacterium]
MGDSLDNGDLLNGILSGLKAIDNAMNTIRESVEVKIETEKNFENEFAQKVDEKITEYMTQNQVLEQITSTKEILNELDTQIVSLGSKYPVLTNEYINGVLVVADSSQEYGNPRRYGAVGDGSTDDTDSFKNMFAVGYKHIYIPEGKFLVNARINISIDGLTIEGESREKSIILVGPKVEMYFAPFYLNGDNLTIRNLTFDGNKENVPGDIYHQMRCLFLHYCNNVSIRDVNFINSNGAGIMYRGGSNIYIGGCYFYDIDTGINNSSNYATDFVVVEECVFDGHTYSEPFVLEYGKHVRITNCKMLNKPKANAIWIGGVDDVIIQNCYIENVSNGIMISKKTINGVDYYADHVLIENNIMTSCYQGIVVNSGKNIKCINNTFQYCFTQIIYAVNVEFESNKFLMNASCNKGILLGGTSKSPVGIVTVRRCESDYQIEGASNNSLLVIQNQNSVERIVFEENTCMNGYPYYAANTKGAEIVSRNNRDAEGKILFRDIPGIKNENVIPNVVGLQKPVYGYYRVGDIVLFDKPTQYIGMINLTEGYAYWENWRTGLSVWPSMTVKLSNGIVITAKSSGTISSGSTEPTITSTNTASNLYVDNNEIKWMYYADRGCDFKNFGEIKG